MSLLLACIHFASAIFTLVSGNSEGPVIIMTIINPNRMMLMHFELHRQMDFALQFPTAGAALAVQLMVEQEDECRTFIWSCFTLWSTVSGLRQLLATGRTG